MEKVMAMNGFEELKENELLDIEGGIPFIPLLIAAGLALTLTGCGTDNTGSTEETVSRSEQQGNYYVHNNLGCHKLDACGIGDPDCPYH